MVYIISSTCDPPPKDRSTSCRTRCSVDVQLGILAQPCLIFALRQTSEELMASMILSRAMYCWMTRLTQITNVSALVSRLYPLVPRPCAPKTSQSAFLYHLGHQINTFYLIANMATLLQFSTFKFQTPSDAAFIVVMGEVALHSHVFFFFLIIITRKPQNTALSRRSDPTRLLKSFICKKSTLFIPRLTFSFAINVCSFDVQS